MPMAKWLFHQVKPLPFDRYSWLSETMPNNSVQTNIMKYLIQLATTLGLICPFQNIYPLPRIYLLLDFDIYDTKRQDFLDFISIFSTLAVKLIATKLHMRKCYLVLAKKMIILHKDNSKYSSTLALHIHISD